MTGRFQSSAKSDNAHQMTLIREWNNIGEELIKQERWDEALEAANKVLKLTPEFYSHHALEMKCINNT